MFTNYYQVRDWLEGFIPQIYSRNELGLERIEYLLKLLGNPQNKFKSIHVAGTGGKGSTAFYVAKLLQLSVLGSQLSGSGQSVSQLTGQLKTDKLISENRQQKTDNWKVGLHLSPHLVYIGERMQINGKAISVNRLIRLMSQIRPMVKLMENSPVGSPSYFEILVAATFKYFAQEKVDWAVVEVGLGGRLDATNVLRPEVCVITNVGLDHTEILGRTVEKIAWEKAGIIKEQVPVVTGASGRALKVIEKVAREKKAPLTRVDTRLRVRPPKSDTKDNISKYYDILRHSRGSFVFSNALLAIEAVRNLLHKPDLKYIDKPGLFLSREQIKRVFDCGLPGRLEEIEPGVILDGAHNPDKICALIQWINATFDKGHLTSDQKRKKSIVNCQWSIVLIVAFKKGKDWQRMVDLLIKNLPVKKVIATKFWSVTDMGRFAAVEPAEIEKYLRVTCHMSRVASFDNSQEAVFTALQSAVNRQLSTVIVTGSLYLVGEVRTMWQLPTFA